jgi:hypothetical protein
MWGTSQRLGGGGVEDKEPDSRWVSESDMYEYTLAVNNEVLNPDGGGHAFEDLCPIATNLTQRLISTTGCLSFRPHPGMPHPPGEWNGRSF